MDMGLFLIRIVVGLLMAAHGAQKLFGWFGGYGLVGTAGFFESLGFRPSRLFAVVASTSELFAGVLVALGFLGPVGPALMLAVMTVAALSVHWNHGLFAASNGIEVPLLYAVVAAGLALAGHGAYSVDAALGASGLWNPTMNLAALTMGVVGAGLALAVRRPAEVGVAA